MDLSWLSIAIQEIDWATLSNIAVVVSAFFIIRQLREMRYTTHAQAYSAAVEILQEGKVRQARKAIFTLKEKPFRKWTKSEIETAEIVCQAYDVVGQMVRHHLLPKEIIVDSWGPSLRNSWPILSSLIYKYREDFGAPEYWDDYEWLVIESGKLQKQRQRMSQLLNRFHTRRIMEDVKSKPESKLSIKQK